MEEPIVRIARVIDAMNEEINTIRKAMVVMDSEVKALQEDNINLKEENYRLCRELTRLENKVLYGI